jgi:hypothetical protein
MNESPALAWVNRLNDIALTWFQTVSGRQQTIGVPPVAAQAAPAPTTASVGAGAVVAVVTVAVIAALAFSWLRR